MELRQIGRKNISETALNVLSLDSGVFNFHNQPFSPLGVRLADKIKIPWNVLRYLLLNFFRKYLNASGNHNIIRTSFPAK